MEASNRIFVRYSSAFIRHVESKFENQLEKLRNPASVITNKRVENVVRDAQTITDDHGINVIMSTAKIYKKIVPSKRKNYVIFLKRKSKNLGKFSSESVSIYFITLSISFCSFVKNG